ncbi:MAG: hypothetical protein HYZ12_04880 [Thaumarchaeota archaeon]|nr:hypothetical protein [Nitrososphaerota archaeon]
METEFYERLYRTWFETTQRLLSSSPQRETPAGGEVGQADWMEGFRAFLGRAPWFPPFSMMQGISGPQLVKYKEFWELANDYARLYKNWMDIWLDFSKTWMDGASSAFKHLKSMKPTVGQGGYGKLVYTVWIQELEARFENLLRDHSFATKLGELLSSFLDVKQRYDSIMEGYFSQMNIPTRAEIDRIQRELYELRKSVRGLAKLKKPRMNHDGQ